MQTSRIVLRSSIDKYRRMRQQLYRKRSRVNTPSITAQERTIWRLTYKIAVSYQAYANEQKYLNAAEHMKMLSSRPDWDHYKSLLSPVMNYVVLWLCNTYNCLVHERRRLPIDRHYHQP